MKCTWPTRRFCIGDPTQPIFNWLALGVTQILAFLDTNMLVYPMQNCGIGGLTQGPNTNGFASQWNKGFRNNYKA